MKPIPSSQSIGPEPICLSESLTAILFRLIQAVKIHKENNPIVVQSLQEFLRALHRLESEEARFMLRVSNGRLYLQEEKVNPRVENANLFAHVIQYFEMRRLHGLSIATNLHPSERDALLVFVTLLNACESQEHPQEWLEQRIHEHGFDWVEMLQDAPSPDHMAACRARTSIQDDQARREAGQNAYVGALSALQEISTKVTASKPGGTRKALRIVQNIVDLLMDDDAVLLGLSTIRDFDDYTYVHSVNVGILAMTLGSRIGLSRDSLEAIGMCGLLHDLGKTEVPLDIINKPGKLTQAEFEEVQKHVLNSVRLILSLKATRDIKSKVIIGPFEHHLKYDLSGYPQTSRKKPLSLYGRIISIADVYDALTSRRVYHTSQISPHRALEIMAKGAGTDFDPILLKVFIKMIGIYPIGTLLRLDSGEIGLVTESSNETDPLRPRVVLLRQNGQEKYTRGATVRLSEKKSGSGAYERNIVGSYHPCMFGIQPAQYLM